MKKPRHEDPTEVILAAARRCYVERGIADTGMKDVALEAGVARSTLYRYFPSRDDVLVAVVMREMIAVNAVIRDKLAQYSEPADMIVEGLILALAEIPKRPILDAVFVSAEASRARGIVWSSNLIVEFGEQLLEHVIHPALELGLLQQRVPPEALTEWVYRILISLLTLPSNWSQSEDDLRTMLHGLLVPVLLR